MERVQNLGRPKLSCTVSGWPSVLVTVLKIFGHLYPCLVKVIFYYNYWHFYLQIFSVTQIRVDSQINPSMNVKFYFWFKIKIYFNFRVKNNIHRWVFCKSTLIWVTKAIKRFECQLLYKNKNLFWQNRGMSDQKYQR